MKLFLLIDTSGSMDGYKIQSVNDTMDNVILNFQEAAHTSGVDIYISVLTFSRKVEWMYPESKHVLDFSWSSLDAGGMTCLGKACLALNDSLCALEEDNEKNVIILMSDGCPTDDFDEGIEALESNKAFNDASRYSIAIGNDASIPTLTRFSTSAEAVYTVDVIDKLYDCINTILENCLSKNPTTTTSSESYDDDEWS